MSTRTNATKGKGGAKPRARASKDGHARTLRVIALYAKGGRGLRPICAEVGIAMSKFQTDVASSPELQAQYARAREMADATEFEQLAEIADEKPPMTPAGAHDSAWVAWQRTRIDTRKWMLARKQPTKYGDRQHVEHSGRLGLESLVAGNDGKPDKG